MKASSHSVAERGYEQFAAIAHHNLGCRFETPAT